MGGVDLSDSVGMVLSGLLLIPYLLWGVQTLRLRYQFHEELALSTEGATMAGILLFYLLELCLLKWSLDQFPVLLMFAILGLFVSGAALYGPLAISLFSRLLVDMLMPAERSKTREPRYAPAEALERDGDYQGALGEYLVIARVFPRDPTVLTRLGEVYIKLEQVQEAALWFERALVCINAPERSLQVMNRLCSLYIRQLELPLEAQRLLGEYIQKYPDDPHTESVRERLSRLKGSDTRPCVLS